MEGDAHQEGRDQAERNAHRERRQKVDTHFRDGRIDEEQSSESEERDAPDGEHAVGGKLGFGGEKCEGGQNEAQRGKARRQQIESEHRDQNEDDANRSGNNRARMIEFGIEREEANGEQDENDVGVHQIIEDLFLQRHAEGHNGLARELQGDLLATEALEAFALHLAEKIVLAGGHIVDEMLRERFLIGEGLGFEYGAYGNFNVAASSGDDRAHESGGIILNFALHFVVDLGREQANQDRMRRSGVGSGSHGCHIGRFQEENSGRTGAAAAGRDVEQDRNRRIRDLLNDVAGGFNGASGSIDLDQYSLIVAALGFVDGAGDVFLGDGLNGVVDDDLEDLSVRDGMENKSCQQCEKNSRDSVAFHRSPIAYNNILTLIYGSRQTFLRPRQRQDSRSACRPSREDWCCR